MYNIMIKMSTELQWNDAEKRKTEIPGEKPVPQPLYPLQSTQT
jgi:hypothetical protein